MVFLTFIRNAIVYRGSSEIARAKATPNDRRLKKLQIFRQSWHMYGRPRKCYSMAVRAVRKAQMRSHFDKKLKVPYMKNLWQTRMTAALDEHNGMPFDDFMETLAQSDVALSRKVLTDIAIYEPRTFQSLAMFAQQHHEEIGDLDDDNQVKPRIFSREPFRKF